MEEIPSPCVKNCCLDDQDICIGCHRTLAEITAWHRATTEEKRVILFHCQLRAKTHNRPSDE